jgi:hypothetical protein
MAKRSIRALVALSIALVFVAVAATTAFGAGAVHFTEDVTGSQFVCETTTYTITEGVINVVIHEGESASGNANFTGTVTPKGVTLEDEAGNTYSIHGAEWFGGTFNNQNGVERGEFTAYFNILSQGGGVVDRVAQTAHFSSDGTEFFLDRSTCVLPEDDE